MVYWVGSAVAMGTRNGAPVAGRGFVELVGYALSILSHICTPLSTSPAKKGNIMSQNETEFGYHSPRGCSRSRQGGHI